MKIWVAADHAGIELKNMLISHLQSLSAHSERDIQVEDLGTHSTDSVDYPDFADAVADQLENSISRHSEVENETKNSTGEFPEAVGILICGSGQGMAMRANKHPHLRAALCWNQETTKLAREHNNANVLCLGARQTDAASALQLVETFLSTPFAGGRHQRRVAKVSQPIG